MEQAEIMTRSIAGDEFVKFADNRKMSRSIPQSLRVRRIGINLK